MAESRAYQRLKKAHPAAHWQRFESWAAIGVFDCNACKDGREIWVENKEVIPPKTLTDDWIVKPKVRPSQIAWQANRQLAGGITYIAIMVGTKMYIIPGNHIFSLKIGMTLGYVKKLNIPVKDLL
jgi:hypothetical protein